MRTSIAITGVGAVSALGIGAPSLLQAMREGRDGLSEMTRFDVSPLHPVRFAGWVREEGAASLEAWAVTAAREAWRDAGLDRETVEPSRIAVVSGTTLGEEGRLARSADAVADALGARGPRWTISTACASSANAIGLARDLIESGDVDIAVAGGAEKLVVEIMAGFAALGVLGAHRCAPFGDEFGTTLGEGAGFVILERAGARRVRPRAYLLGYGLSGDAWHETAPDPRGEGVSRAIRSCLADAGLSAEHVDYVNAHATGTAANDASEWRGIQSALGPRASTIPVSASKGYLGHAQGAAGVLETITTLVCLESGLLPPSARAQRGRAQGPPDRVGETGRAREGNADVALSISAAFGGADAVVALSLSAPRERAETARVVTVAGLASRSTAAGTRRDDAALASACGDVDLRNTDPSSRYAVACVRDALADAGVRIRGDARERSGLFGGCGGPPRASVEEYRVSLDRGLARASAPAFARTVANAPVGAASLALGLRGPSTTVVATNVSGLLAIAYAARWLASRADADRIVAGGLYERDEAPGAQSEGLEEEGAAFVVLAVGGTGPRVLGVGMAGLVDTAIDRALLEAARAREDVDAWHTPRNGARAFDGAGSVLDAARAIREGRERLAVVAAHGPQGAVAMVLARADDTGEEFRP